MSIYRSTVLLFACLACAGTGLAQRTPVSAEPTGRLQEILAGAAPKTLADLKAMQAHVRGLIKKVVPATVNCGGGSGVIVKGGLVLTAGHVIRTAGREIRIVLADGRVIQGKSLGANHRTDTGLVRITTKGKFPYAEMGKSAVLKPGQWCAELGHPGGLKTGRMPPLRVGRVLVNSPGRNYLVSDCPMSAGDSGGPLFDMHGRVIGINSRINSNLAINMHVPIDAFHNEWESLVKGEVTGRMRTNGRGGGRSSAPSLGAILNGKNEVTRVRADSPAAKAGLQKGDVVLAANGNEINRSKLRRFLRDRNAGTSFKLRVQRGQEKLELTVRFPRNGNGGERRRRR